MGTVSFLGVKQPKHGADHTAPSSARLWMDRSWACISPLWLHRHVNGVTLFITHTFNWSCDSTICILLSLQAGWPWNWDPPNFPFSGHHGCCPSRRGVKQPGHEDDNSRPSSAEAKNDWSSASNTYVWLHGVHRDNYATILLDLILNRKFISA